jgi:lysozyme
MRSSGILASLLLCLGMSGCMSGAGLEDMAPRPSMETTSSIPRPEAPVKAADPAAKIAAALPSEAVDDDVGSPEPAALLEPGKPVPASLALIGPPPEKPSVTAKTFRRGVVNEHRFRDAKPINFGTRSPKKLAVHGVDVSRWQGDIDWMKLRSQGANFVYIKATDGGDHLDPMFMKNWRNSADAGLKRGAYHFFYWCRTASEQADWFIRNVPRDANALPPVIDVEWNHESSCKRRPSRAAVLEKMQVFMDRLERHYGKRPIIYTAPDFYSDNLRGAFRDHPFWLRSVAAHPAKVYPGRDWVFWQYSGSGLSHGVSGRIDLNAFNGDEGDWWRWLGGHSTVAAAD